MGFSCQVKPVNTFCDCMCLPVYLSGESTVVKSNKYLSSNDNNCCFNVLFVCLSTVVVVFFVGFVKLQTFMENLNQVQNICFISWVLIDNNKNMNINTSKWLIVWKLLKCLILVSFASKNCSYLMQTQFFHTPWSRQHFLKTANLAKIWSFCHKNTQSRVKFIKNLQTTALNMPHSKV